MRAEANQVGCSSESKGTELELRVNQEARAWVCKGPMLFAFLAMAHQPYELGKVLEPCHAQFFTGKTEIAHLPLLRLNEVTYGNRIEEEQGEVRQLGSGSISPTPSCPCLPPP